MHEFYLEKLILTKITAGRSHTVSLGGLRANV